jgi:hypothetical protein
VAIRLRSWSGVAALFWFPNVLVLPAIAVAVLIWRTPDWQVAASLRAMRLRALIALASGFAVVLLVGYGIGTVAASVRSPEQFLAWYHSADHGWALNRCYIRIVTGFARLLFDLAEEGIALKRLAFGDPYARTSAVVPAIWGVAKLGVFYLSFGITVLLCLKGKRQQEGGLVLAAALAALGAFAIVFEPSTPSRFIALLPFYFVALALVLNGRGTPRWARFGAAVGPMAALILNTWAFAFDNPCTSVAHSRRFDTVQQVASPGDVAVAITGMDDLYYTADACRLHPSAAGVYQLLDPSNAAAVKWSTLFARKVLETWQAGHEVWLPKRLLADKPLPEWNWTEGDNPAVSWKHLVAFSRQLGWDMAVGDTDGFVRISRSGDNERLLTRMANGDPALGGAAAEPEGDGLAAGAVQVSLQRRHAPPPLVRRRRGARGGAVLVEANGAGTGVGARP